MGLHASGTSTSYDLYQAWFLWKEVRRLPIPTRSSQRTLLRTLGHFTTDATFWLKFGSVLLTVELFYLQLFWRAFLLTIGADCSEFQSDRSDSSNEALRSRQELSETLQAIGPYKSIPMDQSIKGYWSIPFLVQVLRIRPPLTWVQNQKLSVKKGSGSNNPFPATPDTGVWAGNVFRLWNSLVPFFWRIWPLKGAGNSSCCPIIEWHWGFHTISPKRSPRLISQPIDCSGAWNHVWHKTKQSCHLRNMSFSLCQKIRPHNCSPKLTCVQNVAHSICHIVATSSHARLRCPSLVERPLKSTP